ncbi:hypothetical protein D3C81_2016130 [compost metagenome]
MFDRSYRILTATWPVNDRNHDFLFILGTIQVVEWNKDIVQHLAIIGDKKCEII